MIKKLKEILNKLLSIIIVPLGALLGAIGGAGNKSARRIGIPFSITGLAYLQLESIFVLTIMSMAGALSIGYGIPKFEEHGGSILPIEVDSGSAIGRFWYKLFNQNHLLADIFTRGTCGLFISLSLISIPIIKYNWLIYGLCSLGIILTESLISWRNLGSYKLFGKELSWVETITWGLITLFATLIIKL
jgi:hypothetical protein